MTKLISKPKNLDCVLQFLQQNSHLQWTDLSIVLFIVSMADLSSLKFVDEILDNILRYLSHFCVFGFLTCIIL